MESPLSPILINRCLVFTFFALFNQLNSQINANISPPPPLPQPPATPPPLAPPPPSDGLRPVPPPESQSPAETPLNPAPLPHAQSLPNALSDQINKSPAIFQFGVVGFLAFKRRQLLQITDRYGTCSA
ncbi:sulfated surface glycoprotein 185-like [Mangifera indica]|uniref:sulfated surface glycoprotein 185-like n=1 Tax=Mangifera indica TaxID=29780 RepID=UPI001CFBC55C|nr:sulfated surface glycoprotein 185-like [Mangifera indica]